MKARAKAEWDKQQKALKRQKVAAAASEAALQERMQGKMAKQKVEAEAHLTNTVGEWEQKVEAERNITAEVKRQAAADRSELEAQHAEAINVRDEQLLALDLEHEVWVYKLLKLRNQTTTKMYTPVQSETTQSPRLPWTSCERNMSKTSNTQLWKLGKRTRR